MASPLSSLEPSCRGYVYTPLRSTSAFRVLELLPGKENQPISYSLKEEDWNSPPKYEAISYAWGDPEPVRQTICNCRPHKITENLWQALFHLRFEDKSRLLWADAVCIDQSNLKERGHQVNNMKKIYENSLYVLAWLSMDPDDKGKGSMKWIEETSIQLCHETGVLPENMKDLLSLNKAIIQVLRNSKSDVATCFPSNDSSLWDSIRWFYSHSWFDRLWVIQEVNSGPNVSLICGKNAIDWQFVVLMTELFAMSPAVVHAQHLEYTKYRYAWIMRRHYFRIQSDVVDILDHVRDFQATDPRDKIYALFGLPGFASKCFPLEADYSKPEDQVFIEFTEAWIKNSSSLDILSHIQHPSQCIQKPSWVPRWDPITVHVINKEWLKFSASNYSPTSVKINKERGIMEVLGIRLDSVAAVNYIDRDKLMPRKSTGDKNNTAEFWSAKIKTKEDLQTYSMVFSCEKKLEKGRIRGILADENSVAFQAFLRKRYGDKFFHDTSISLSEEETDIESFLFPARQMSWHRSFFKTKVGYIGLGPGDMQSDDIVCILFGGGVPLILRPENDHYLLIGECYVYGIMHGEIMDKFRAGELPHANEQVFEIH